MLTEPDDNKKQIDNEPSELSVDQKGIGKSADSDAILMTDTEAFLREAFRKNEWLGCTLLFDHYYAPMCSHAVRYVYSKEYAEDVVADVFRKFWQKKQFEKVTTSFRTYLFGAVRNRSMNMIRRELRQTTALTDCLGKISESMRPDEQMMYDQFYQNIQRCIDQLPPMCRKVFLMSRFESKPHREISNLLGISIRTVEAHISKALTSLRTNLKNDNI